MKVLRVHRHFLFTCLLLIPVTMALDVTRTRDGEITTFLQDVKLQGLSFAKRSVNRTAGTSVVFEIHNVSDPSVYSFSWYHNNDDISNFVTAYDRNPPLNPTEMYTTQSLDSTTLHVTLHLKNRRLIPGEYKVSVSHNGDSASAVAIVNSPPILPLFPKVRINLPGDRLSLLCQVTGYPLDMRVSWRFAHIKRDLMRDNSALAEAQSNLKALTNDRDAPYKFETNSVSDDQLVFEELPELYGGLYECSVSKDGNGDQSLVLVHIKDRYAALWPFIAIVIEVIFLVVGILLYERHQMRTRAATKNDHPQTAEPTGPPPDSSPKAVVDPQLMSTGTPLHNNLPAGGEAQVEPAQRETNRPNGAEAGDDVRLRSVAPC